MQELSRDEIFTERDNLYSNLQSIPEQQDILNDELDQIDDKLKEVTVELAAKGEKPEKELKPILKRKEEIIDSISSLNLQRSAIGDRMIAVNDEIKRRCEEQLRKAKRDAKPKLTKALEYEKTAALSSLARIAVLTELVEALPASMIPMDRACRMLDKESYRILRQNYFNDISNEHGFNDCDNLKI